MDPTLSRNDHIYYIGKKISARLGMLRRAHKILPRSACITLYNAMILPLFDYRACVIDSCGKGHKEYLDKLHRCVASIKECRPVQQADLHLTFTWPSLQLRRNFLICALVYKCLNNLAPNYLLSNFQRSQEFHMYNARCKDFLRLPRAKTTKYQGSFRINGARTWNTLLPQIRKENSFSAFKAKLKQYLII